MALDTTFNRVVATTLPLYAPRITESIVGAISLLWKLGLMGGVETRRGGNQVVEPVILNTNSTVKSYSDFDPLDVTVQSDPNVASFLWKILAGTTGLGLLEQAKNSNSAVAPVDLWDAVIKQLAVSMRIETNRQLFLDGTGNGGRDLTGLAIGLDFAGNNSTYGNIDSSAFANWRNQTVSSSANVLGSSANNALIPPLMRQLANKCSSQNEWPTMYITSKDIHEGWENTLTGNERYVRDVSDDDMTRSGFVNFVFKGGVMVFDDQIFPNTLSASPSATAGHGFLALNLNYLKFVMMDGYEFAMSDPIQPYNQLAETIQMTMFGNLVMSNRRRQGRINFQTA